MDFREWLNQSKAARVGIAVVLIAAVAYAVVYLTGGSGGGDGAAATVYYYDMASGRLFAGEEKPPPIAAPSGGVQFKGNSRDAGARAYVFKCGGCDQDLVDMTAQEIGQAGAKLVYLEIYTDEHRQRLSAEGAGRMGSIMYEGVGELVAKVPDEAGSYPTFHDKQSPAGRRVTRAAEKKCPDGTPPRVCRPH